MGRAVLGMAVKRALAGDKRRRIRGVKREFFGLIVVHGHGRNSASEEWGKDPMNHLFHELRSVLFELKTLERESVDADASYLIDKALELLEQITQGEKSHETLVEVLEIIGNIAAKMPAIVAFIEYFKDRN